MCFENKLDVFGERVPEGGGSYGGGAPGPVLGPERWRQEVGIRGGGKERGGVNVVVRMNYSKLIVFKN